MKNKKKFDAVAFMRARRAELTEEYLNDPEAFEKRLAKINEQWGIKKKRAKKARSIKRKKLKQS